MKCWCNSEFDIVILGCIYYLLFYKFIYDYFGGKKIVILFGLEMVCEVSVLLIFSNEYVSYIEYLDYWFFVIGDFIYIINIIKEWLNLFVNVECILVND